MQIESRRELPARVSSRIEKSARRSFDPKTLHNSNSCLFVQQHCLALRVHQSLTPCSDTVKSPDTVHQHCPRNKNLSSSACHQTCSSADDSKFHQCTSSSQHETQKTLHLFLQACHEMWNILVLCKQKKGSMDLHTTLFECL